MAITLDGTNGITSPDFIPSSSNIPTNGLFLPTTNSLAWATNSTERLRLDASGNLGLGVTPSANWSIASTPVIQFGLYGSLYSTTTPTTSLGTNFTVNGSTYSYISSNFASQYYQSAGQHVWRTAPSGTAGNAISFTQAMTLDASGNLGIGTTSPATTLHARKDSAGAITYPVYVDNGAGGAGTNVAAIGFTNAGVMKSSITAAVYGNDYMTFCVGSGTTERMRIDAAGNLLVGTTSQLIGTGATITTASRSSSVQVNIQAANGAGYDASLYFECPGIFGATIQTQRSSGLLRIWNGAGTAGVTLSGAGTSWGTFSDERLKDIIEPIENAVTKVNGLRAVIAKYKTDPHDKRRAVLIAQDVVQVLPEAVYDDKSEEKYLSVAYTDTIPLLVAAIKELTARLEALENK